MLKALIENIFKPVKFIGKKLFFYNKWTRYYIWPTIAYIQYQYHLIKYRKNAYPKSFDWNWWKIPYNRMAAINHIVTKLPDCAYLEIGAGQDQLNFGSVLASKKTGVDPGVSFLECMTSDDFFAKNTEKYDVIFIDGYHEYHQVHREIMHSIECLNPGGWILLHDMLPLTWIAAHHPEIVISSSHKVDRGSGPKDMLWGVGNAWKVGFELIQTKGIEFKIIKIDNGVGVVKLIEDKPKLADLRGDLDQKQFSYYYENIDKLPLCEWDEYYDWVNKLFR